MLTLADCVAFCGLSEDELQLVADHEHLPLVVAAELAADLLKTAKGTYLIRSYMLDQLAKAAANGEQQEAKRLDRIISKFVAGHPVPPVL
jgi:hypothetical protein